MGRFEDAIKPFPHRCNVAKPVSGTSAPEAYLDRNAVKSIYKCKSVLVVEVVADEYRPTVAKWWLTQILGHRCSLVDTGGLQFNDALSELQLEPGTERAENVQHDPT
jgi:hypothetical protein